MSLKDVVISFIAVAALVVGYLAYDKDITVNQLGAMPSPEITERIKTLAGLSEAGVLTVATTSATLTLTDSQLRTARTISVTDMGAGQAALALSLPASTTWTSLQRNGDSQTWIIDNLPATAGTTTTITAGTGVDIDGDTANDDVINGGVSGWLTCWKLPNSDIRCYVVEGADAG